MDLRVLHIVQTPLDFVSGPATYVLELSKHLTKNGVKVGVVSPNPSEHTDKKEVIHNDYGVETYYVKLKFFKSFIRAPWVFSITAHKLISRIVKNYDVVNVHVESTFLQQVTSTFNLVRLISTIHSIYPHEDIEVIKHDPLSIYRFFRLMFISPQHYITLKNLISNSESVISVAGFLAKMIRSMFNIRKERIVVIPNSVDTEFFKPIKKDLALKVLNEFLLKRNFTQIPENTVVVLFLGRLDPRKGLHILIRSLNKIIFKNWVLIIAGVGQPDYIRRIIKLTAMLSLTDKVRIIGKVPRCLLPYLYSSASIYVLPSTFEGLPATILEAMACGCPIIATKVSGIPEAVEFDRNVKAGILIDKPDPLELSKALDLLLENETLRNIFSQNALRNVRSKFAWSINVKKYMDVINKLV